MAMSSGNSIFIPKRLLSDPWDDDTRGPAIKSIIGNLGRPGIAMLMPPQSPRMREPGHDSWTQISHHPFDGKLENNFQHTTLHLTFSDYELPIDVGQHGLRDRQIYSRSDANTTKRSPFYAHNNFSTITLINLY
ncbi:hypothetical protein BGZ57DRAFT_936000 [Hyaloscypha finlandica]|nr:hypothetical protein BGZ57DRAFT_936000 [Hyaloscypha finlandica]